MILQHKHMHKVLQLGAILPYVFKLIAIIHMSNIKHTEVKADSNRVEQHR